VVEDQGRARARAFRAAASRREAWKVTTDNARAMLSQKSGARALLSDMPETEVHQETTSSTSGRRRCRSASRGSRQGTVGSADLSHPAIAVNLDACIQCTRCLRACREEQVNDVIGYAFRGEHSKIVFDFDDPMGQSTCVACGECVQACPTGALMPAREVGLETIDKTVDSVCPFCGVGCLLTYHVKQNVIQFVTGKDGPSNHNRLCVKGRYGFDYAAHPQRLTKPLIRKPGFPKTANFTVDPANWTEVFREATWEDALEVAVNGLKAIREKDKYALAGFGSAKGSNEEAYLFQKLVRAGFGTNNVDHCTRLCHASSVAALLEGIGSGAVSNQVNDVENAEVIFLIGANPTSNHPVAATWLKNAAKRGAKLIYADPRRSDLSRHAWRMLQFKADTDVALLNAMIHAVIDENLVNESFVKDRTSGYEALKENAKNFSPEKMAPICGIPAETIRECARAFATSKGSMILWGMGISQHVHGTDNARCLIALCLMTGQVGKPGSGLHPLRGQNNVQARRLGLIPMMYPDYQRVATPGGEGALREVLGRRARPEARPHRGRDRQRGLRRQDPRHVHHGREPGDVRPGRRARARRHGESSSTSWCRIFSDGNRHTWPTWCCRPRRGRRRPAPSPTPTAWCSSAARRWSRRARRARISGSWSSSARRLGLEWKYTHPERGVRRDARLHGLDQRHHLGAAGARLVGDLSVRARGRSGAAGGVHHALSRPRPGRAKVRARPT
jgi:formate dehydrogenase major subunit